MSGSSAGAAASSTPASRPRRPRERRPRRPVTRVGDKRERILAAAVRVFARKGFHATRVSEVAKAAGVADGTIYLYFESKEHLLVSLFEDRVERLLAYLESELPRASSASHRLQRIVEMQLGLLEGERDLAEVVTVILRQSTKLLREYAAPKFNAYLDVIARVIAEGQAAGELRDDVSPHLAARALFGALDAITMTWALGRAEHGGLLRASGQLVEIVLRGLTPPAGR
ncbi:MAG TPA: TetR/AcrR family transcriptional regulator [Polyangiaceae bacterium]|nr:TetR/AcrR family transcriptional regulator [Polyangiaceae bacterium]